MITSTLQEWNHEWECYIKRAQSIVDMRNAQHWHGVYHLTLDQQLMQLKEESRRFGYDMPTLCVIDEATILGQGPQLSIRVSST